jgi:hypothetical protein
MAEAMGWPDKSIGWSDMLALIENPQGWGAFGRPEWGRFSWGHTDPEISTTALSTLLAEFYAATGKQRDLTVADIQKPESQEFIRKLGKGIKHYGYNTLVFSENMRKFGMGYISAFPMEEITLIDFNKNKNPPTPLVAIYPRDQAYRYRRPRGGARYQLLFPLVRVNFELGVIMVIAVSCVKLLSAHNSTQHTSRKHKV